MSLNDFLNMIENKIDALETDADQCEDLSRKLSLKDQILILTELYLEAVQNHRADMTDYLYEQEKDRRAGL